ncbi:Retinoblastoma-associated protein B-box, partial [Trinorchestia longiramus]
CSVELVLTCYNDPRRFPWSLQVGNVPAYHLVRIIEPVVRSELQCDNRLSRDLVKHLKRIEEQILDLLAWQSNSPLWTILEEDSRGLPSCKDVNFSHFLDTADRTSKVVNGSAAVNGESGGATGQPLAPPSAAGGTSVIMSPAGNRAAQLNKPYSSPRQSPLSSAANERLALQSPPAGSKGSVKRTLLFPSDTAPQKTPSITAPSSPSTVVVRPPTSDAAAPHQPTPSVTLRLVPDPPKLEESSGERPRRHGSLALFFRKVYNVANLRLGDLCDRLQIDSELRRKIWTCLENSIIHHSHLLKDRHLDQLIMCAIYIVCKVTGNDRIFQDIMKQYRCQPQADSLIYRSVLIRRLSATTGEPEESDDSSSSTSRNKCLPPTGLTPVCDSNASSSRSSKRTNLLPWKVNGTSTSFKKEERGDLIRFYNHVYVQEIKTFALKFKPNNQDGLTPHLPPLSPVPMVRATPVSPRRRISSSRPVFVHSLSPATSAAAASPRRPLPYFFNWSPNKNLRAINSLVHLRASNNNNNNNNNSSSSSPYKRRLSPTEDSSNKRLMRGISRRLSTVLDDRQKTSDSGLPESASLPGSLSHSGDGGNLIITNGDGGEVNSVVGVPMEHDENTPVVG